TFCEVPRLLLWALEEVAGAERLAREQVFEKFTEAGCSVEPNADDWRLVPVGGSPRGLWDVYCRPTSEGVEWYCLSRPEGEDDERPFDTLQEAMQAAAKREKAGEVEA